MRFVTQTRINHLRTLLEQIEDRETQKEAAHLLASLERDIEENYAEIQRPIRIFEK